MKIQFHRIDTNVVIGLLVREFCCSGTDVSAKVLAMYADTRTPPMEPQWLAAGLSQRADDSYFSFARAFISNEISLSQLNYAMRLGKLGEQYVLKSEKAFQQIEFKTAELADNTIYYARRKIRDDEARNAFFVELEKEDLNGIYMRDIIREGMTSDDARLR